jgi:broad specificity phosphatase PhoE
MSDTTRVLLIRHGQSQGNAEGRFGGHTETPLSKLGRQQAKATVRALSSETFQAIYASDLPRAVETALPLARAGGLSVNQTEAFRERSVGVMEGLTFEQYAALIRRDFEHVILGGESYRQMLDRASQKLDEIIDGHRGGRIAVFSHTGTICILALHLMGALDAPHLRPVWITTANCSITRFDLRADGYVRVLAINDTRHLSRIRTSPQGR